MSNILFFQIGAKPENLMNKEEWLRYLSKCFERWELLENGIIESILIF